LKGVRYLVSRAATLLRNNTPIYGVGGIIVPFVGIKLIDLILVALSFLPRSIHHAPQAAQVFP
jgi:K+-transporting ATPase ATPase B chain